MDVRVLERFVSSAPSQAQRILLAVAAQIEAQAVITGLGGPDTLIPRAWEPVALGRFDVVLTGISKANAAAAVARVVDPGRHGAILSLGIAGVYAGIDLPLGAAIAATVSFMADEGVRTPDGFIQCSDVGFPLGDFPGSAVPVDPTLLALLAPITDATGPIATVSTCSGTDLLAGEIACRTGAWAEGMEGAAVGLVAHRLGIPFAEIRAISNSTGDRDRQVWKIAPALARLSAVASRL